MTSISFDRVGAARAPFVWPANAASRVSLGATAIMLALLAPTLIAFAFDDRQVNGVDVWMKPIHFQLAIALHGLTIAALAPLLRADALNSALLRRFVTASAVASVFEIGYIMEQAARGRGSHFNFATPLETALYGVMGAGATLMVAASFVLGWMIWRHGRDDIGAGLRLGSGLGLMLGSAATLIVAGVLSSGQIDGPGHWIGGVHSDAHGLPFLGWSTSAGDLRAPHFFATHAMQALPAVGWLADRALGGSAPRIVWIATGLWAVLTLATFVQALSGAPLIRLGL